jgi:hypothetical protein
MSDGNVRGVAPQWSSSSASMGAATGQAWLPAFVFACLFWLLVGPRIELANVYGSSVRVDDLVLIGGFVVTWFSGATKPAMPLARPLIGVVAAGLVAALIGTAVGTVEIAPALLYALRVGEYFLVYPTLAIALTAGGERCAGQFEKLLMIVTVLQVGVATAQTLLGLNVGFSKFSFERGAGLTAGPYELGAICAALAVVWFARQRYLLFVLAVLGLLLSASRISMAAVAIGLAVYVVVRRRERGRAGELPEGSKRGVAYTFRPLVIACAASVALLSVDSGVGLLVSGSLDRAGSTSITDEWRLSGALAEGNLPFTDAAAYHSAAYVGFTQTLGMNSAQPGSDVSNLVRFYRWHMLLNSMTPVSWGVGLGPSFAGASVDGAFLRVVVETGVLGAMAWVLFMKAAWRRQAGVMRGVLITYLVGSVFIDLLFAFRPSVLIWALLAYALRFGEEGK